MNTGIRRFILRLGVGLLAFLLGITAAWALGGFNPFQSFSGTRHYRHKRCGSHRSWTTTPEPSFLNPIFRERRSATGAWNFSDPPPASAPEAPALPMR